jgi:hypothetical protein
MLALALSLVCSTVPQTSDPVPLIITPGTDGIATVTPEYNVSITPPIVVDANTTFTDVVRLYCPLGYNDTIGIANLALNSSQIKELQIFVNYSNQKIILIQYQDWSLIQNNTFALYPETEAIMGISIIPAPAVINAGPIDPIYYNIFCSYEVGVCGVNITDIATSHCGTPVDFGYTTWDADAPLKVNVTVHNNGTIRTNCTVNAYYQNDTTWVQIGTPQVVTGLDPCNTTTLTFNWNLTGLTQNTTYTLKANVTSTCGASDTATTTVHVRYDGDVDGSNKVNVIDMLALKILITVQDTCAEAPQGDVNGDGKVNVIDMLVLKIIITLLG